MLNERENLVEKSLKFHMWTVKSAVQVYAGFSFINRNTIAVDYSCYISSVMWQQQKLTPSLARFIDTACLDGNYYY